MLDKRVAFLFSHGKSPWVCNRTSQRDQTNAWYQLSSSIKREALPSRDEGDLWASQV